MGKSSKKSTPKVDAASTVKSVSKSGKKGKREAEESIEKPANVKKQKSDNEADQPVQKQKIEIKTQKKKKEESSSSDGSSSEEDKQVKVVNKVPTKPMEPPVKESSSEESSSSEEEPPVKAALPPKKVQVETKNGTVAAPKKGKEDSSSSDSSDDDSDSNEDSKNGLLSKKEESSNISDSSSSDSDADENVKVSFKPTVHEKKLPETGLKKVSSKSSETSSDSSESESSSDEEPETSANALSGKEVPAVASKKKADSDDSSEDSDLSSVEKKVSPAKPSAIEKVSAATKNKAESTNSSDNSDSDGSSDDNKISTDKVPVSLKRPSAQLINSKKESEDDGKDDTEDDSSEDSEDESKNKKAKTMVQEEISDEENLGDASDDEKDGEDEKSAKTHKKIDADVEKVDAVKQWTTSELSDFKSSKKAPPTPDTPEAGSKTLFVGNLPFHVERADMDDFFKGIGEIIDIRFALDADQRFRGFGHVEFATVKAAQKALELNGQSLSGREVRLDFARGRGDKGDRGSNTPYSGKENNSFQRGERGQAQKIFVRGFDKSLGVEEVRSSLQEHFETCGEIIRISIPTDYETGAIKGHAYLEFKNADAFNKALELGGSQLGDKYLTVEEARRRGDSRDGWSGGRGGGRDGGGRIGGRDGGGRFGGRRGGRDGSDRGSGAPNKISVAVSGKKTTFKDDEE